MRSWVAVLRATYEAKDYTNALAIAEVVRTNAERELFPSEGDYVAVTTLVPLGLDDDREEVVAVLRRARNALIRLGEQRAVDVARDVDMLAEIVSNRAADMDYHPPYNYNKFMDVVTAISKGKDPGV